jgi:hypothetical protein
MTSTMADKVLPLHQYLRAPNLVEAGRLLTQYEHLLATRTRGGFDQEAAVVWRKYKAEIRLGRVPVKRANVPRWLRARLNAVLDPWSKIPNKNQVGVFLMNGGFPGFSARECRLFDHWGTDPEDNLVTEPYAKNCVTCLTQSVVFAETLNLGLYISDDPWWAPHLDECVRITFTLEPRDLLPSEAAARWIAPAQAWNETLNKKENESENSHSEN